ncbi:hypothetical protein KSP35_06200 [Aquihabitans sp. G128]|uniref:hypothetical protein n=1 Tax=Aquihabitans sp. G128 TaxID=2849779 RepID=UPI001C24FBD3|nr:hypothetical protein [Aquihabitans sp. G128]QXC62390.1 hypothetical protein KSP35_06200 [Aquihabitans sp. G128]
MKWFSRAAARRRARAGSPEDEFDPFAAAPVPETAAEAAGDDAHRAQLSELAHALDAFADVLRLDRARPEDQAELRDVAGMARMLSVRPHGRIDELALTDRVPHLVEPDDHATKSPYGHYQLRIDRAADALRAD